jgi:hypothetical protein
MTSTERAGLVPFAKKVTMVLDFAASQSISQKATYDYSASSMHTLQRQHQTSGIAICRRLARTISPMRIVKRIPPDVTREATKVTPVTTLTPSYHKGCCA